MKSNQETLQSYEAHIQEYVDGTPQQVGNFVKEWIDASLTYVPLGGRVLELGSAFGRDAEYLEQAGYDVRRTDAVNGFVELLRSQGHEAQLLNAITDDLGGPYDMVFADAVLLHFTMDEFQIVLRKVHDSLRRGGIFAFTLKQGEGAEWSTDKLGAPRFFQYWQETDLQKTLAAHHFSVRQLAGVDAGKWWQVITQIT